MEEHIIAAHAALIIGYMLLSDHLFNNNSAISNAKTSRGKNVNGQVKLINLEREDICSRIVYF